MYAKIFAELFKLAIFIIMFLWDICIQVISDAWYVRPLFFLETQAWSTGY